MKKKNRKKKERIADSAPAAAPVPVSRDIPAPVPPGWWRRREYQVMALVALLCLVTFGHNITFTFIPVDLPQMIFENEHIMTGPSWENIKWAFTEPNLALYQPLPNLTFMIDSQLFGYWPGGYHTVTLLWHIACTWLFFWVMLRLVKNFPVVFVATLLMAVHPVQLSVVSTTGSRNEVMQAVFMLLSVDAYRRYATEQSRRAYWCSVLFMGLGLLCKQIIVMLPVVLLLLDYWPLRRIEISFRRLGATFRAAASLAVEKAPFFALSFLGAFLAFYGKMQYDQIRYHVMRLTIPDAIYFVITGYARYLGHLAAPYRLSYFEAYAEQQYLWLFLLSVATLTVISVVSLVLLWKRPYIIVGWLWFVALLFPVSGIVRYMLESIALRYLYAPAMGLYIAISYGFYELACRIKTRKAASITEAKQPEGHDEEEKGRSIMPKWYWATVSVVVLILAGLAFWQNEFLCDTETAVNRMLKVTGDRSSFGHGLLAVLRMDENNFEEAQKHFERAIEIQPYTYIFRYKYASALYIKGYFKEAVKVMEPAVEADPDNPDFLSLYAMGLMGMGQYKQSEQHFKRSLELRPNDPPTIQNLAYCLILRWRFEEAGQLLRMLVENDLGNPAVEELVKMVEEATGKPLI